METPVPLKAVQCEINWSSDSSWQATGDQTGWWWMRWWWRAIIVGQMEITQLYFLNQETARASPGSCNSCICHIQIPRSHRWRKFRGDHYAFTISFGVKEVISLFGICIYGICYQRVPRMQCQKERNCHLVIRTGTLTHSHYRHQTSPWSLFWGWK